jgi:hypothetical protein
MWRDDSRSNRIANCDRIGTPRRTEQRFVGKKLFLASDATFTICDNPAIKIDISPKEPTA